MSKLIVVLVVCAVILMLLTDARRHHRDSPSPPKDDEQTFNYACGYRAGQNAVMERLGSLVEPGAIVPLMEECAPYSKRAREHGFPGVGGK